MSLSACAGCRLLASRSGSILRAPTNAAVPACLLAQLGLSLELQSWEDRRGGLARGAIATIIDILIEHHDAVES